MLLTPPKQQDHSKTGPVVVRRFGQFVSVSPPVPELEERFSTVYHGAANDPDLGFCVIPVADPLVRTVHVRHPSGGNSGQCRVGRHAQIT